MAGKFLQLDYIDDITKKIDTDQNTLRRVFGGVKKGINLELIEIAIDGNRLDQAVVSNFGDLHFHVLKRY